MLLIYLLINSDHLSAVKGFLQFGLTAKVDVLDTMLLHAMKMLLPEYTKFITGAGGHYIRLHVKEYMPELLYLAATRIQSMWRAHVHYKIVKEILYKKRKHEENIAKRSKFLRESSKSKL